jgi:hypothetical protein
MANKVCVGGTGRLWSLLQGDGVDGSRGPAVVWGHFCLPLWCLSFTKPPRSLGRGRLVCWLPRF